MFKKSFLMPFHCYGYTAAKGNEGMRHYTKLSYKH